MEFRNRLSLLTLEQPGSEGGSGGGGGIEPPAQETGLPPLPSGRARSEIYDRADSTSGKGDTTQHPPMEPEKKVEGAPEGTAKPEDSAPAPEEKEKKGKALTPEQIADKRVHDAQADATRRAQENAELKKSLDEKEARLKLAEKYVDFDKLSEFDKQQIEKEAGEPVSRKEFEERVKERSETKPTEPTAEEEERVRQQYMTGYVDKFPHMKGPIDEGLVYGVFLKTAEKMGPDATLDQIGDEVAGHFRKMEAEREKKVAEKLTVKKTALSQGEGLKSGGAPRSGEDEGPEVDDPAAEMAQRVARRNRTLNPRL